MTSVGNTFMDEIDNRTSVESSQVSTGSGTRVSRESGDEVNRFLLCATVSRSAKAIKAKAERAGQYIPMTMIVRRVLGSYRLAAGKEKGLFAGPELNMTILRSLNEKVLREVIAHHCQDRVRNSQEQLARANHDDAKIKSLQDTMDRALADRDRFAIEFRSPSR